MTYSSFSKTSAQKNFALSLFLSDLKSVFVLSILFLLTSSKLIAQTVDEPVLIRTENNGVKIYTSKGYENNSIISNELIPVVQPNKLTIYDFTLEEIESMILDSEFKLQYYQSLNDEDAIKIVLSQQSELIERRNVLTNQN